MTDHLNSRTPAALQSKPGSSRPVEPGMNRRAMMAGVGAALAGAATISATLPALAVSAVEENGDRLDRLMQEIAEILDDALMGTFTAVIKWRTAAHEGGNHDFLLIKDAKTTREEASVFVQNLTMGGAS